MHNIISQDQLAEWTNLDVKLSDYQNELDKVNDYFGCLIECEKINLHVRGYVSMY